MREAGENIKITNSNLTINYDDYGPVYAPAVIFIHGFPFNKSMWEMQTEALKSNYRVISYDIRGFGDSPAVRSDFTLDALTADLMTLIDTLQLKKVALCGLSMGGYIALNAVEKYPDRFNALILSDTHCLPDSRETKDDKMKVIKCIKEKGLSAFADISMRYFFASTSLHKKNEAVRAAKKMILSTSVSSICNALLTLEQKQEACSKLSEIRIPVLIMVGKEDALTPPAMAMYMHEKIKDSSFYIIQYAGHLPNLENTEEFNLHLKKFMDKVSSRKRQSELVLNTNHNSPFPAM
jgi:3-oxoadipate enol-lactonase